MIAGAGLVAVGAVAAGGVASGLIKPSLGGQASTAMQVEQRAGTWKTWLLSSGSQLRLAAPPDQAATQAEIGQLKTLASQRNQAALDRVTFWSVASPAFRWNEIAVGEGLKRGISANRAIRALALLNTAIYDATIAAWDSKYAHNRQRPSQVDSSLGTAIPNPASPSYPSEHAATAGAASAVLAYLFPDAASTFLAQADEAGQSRLVAGVEDPSDVKAGLDLGRQVAALAIERAKSDGSDAKWDGKIPTGPGYWNGTNPVEPTGGTWKPWVLASGSELRPAPPPAYDSDQKKSDLAEIKTFNRTPLTNNIAFFWQYAVAGYNVYQYWYEQTSQKISQYGFNENPPLAARAYALASATLYDATVACWDAKYTYWAIRPFQLDPDVKPLFPTPNHPSYPAAHGTLSGAMTAILGYLFPSDAQHFRALGEQAAESRVWAGIHYRSDIVAGLALGRGVAQKAIERGKGDGSG